MAVTRTPRPATWTAARVGVVVLVIVGGLALLGQLQALNARQDIQVQQAQVYVTATAVATRAVALFATQQAVQQTETARTQATADTLVATSEARRETAGAIVRATETAMAGRR